MNGEELYVNNIFNYHWALLWRPGLPRPRLCLFVCQALPRVAT